MHLKINKTALSFFIIFIILGIMLIVHYINMGVQNVLFGFGLILTFGILSICLSIQKWKDFINPVSLYFIFIFGFAFSQLNLSTLVKSFNIVSIAILVLSICSYLIGTFINIRFKSPFKFIYFNTKTSLILFYLIIIFSVFSFIIEVLQIGYLPILRIFSFDIYNDSNKKLVSFIHYFIMLFAIYPAWSFILLKGKIISKTFYIALLIFSFFILLNYLSRQMIMLYMLSSLISYSFYNKISIKKLLFYTFFIISFFFIIGQIRISQMDTIKKVSGYTAAKFLHNAAGMKYESNTIESTFILYSSIRYNSFNEFVKKANNEDYMSYGRFVFRPIISLFFLDRLGLINYSPEYSLTSNISTYAIDSYLDFGFLGVILFGLFYGLSAKHFYSKFKSRDKKYIIPWTIIIFCLIMCPFMNYFDSFFVFLVWSVNKLIIS